MSILYFLQIPLLGVILFKEKKKALSKTEMSKPNHTYLRNKEALSTQD